MSDAPVIRLEGVCKTYQTEAGSVHAVADVNLDVRRGEFWAVMGPSGSGKSTMLNLLGCLDRPSAGEYILDGQSVRELGDDDLSRIRLQRIGFIFQSFNLVAQLTVRENIELPLYYQGKDAGTSAQRAEVLAEQVGLADRLHHRPSELSGGQRQRVAVARALANDPAVILADEPTGNLDTATGQQIIRLLQQLNRDGRTIIMVTHEDDVAAVAGCSLHMRDGRVERVERCDG